MHLVYNKNMETKEVVKVKKHRRGRPNEGHKMIMRGIAAYPEEFERWQVRAEAEQRSLSNWIRMRLLQAEARDEEAATRFTHSPSTPEA